MGCFCCFNSIYNKVKWIAVLQVVVNTLSFAMSALAIIFSSRFELHFDLPPFDCFLNEFVKNILYLVLSLLGIAFGFVLLMGVQRKSELLCKWWLPYSVITFIIQHIYSLLALAAFSLDTQGVVLDIANAVCVCMWYGFAIWTVIKFMDYLKKDPEVRGTGFYANMETNKGPSVYAYKAEST